MIQDDKIMRSVARVVQRAEKQSDTEKIIASYVDVGILPQLDNNNNQIIYGRRGTGKTHILRILGSQLEGHPKITTVYLDARTLGSSTQFSDSTVSIKHRCLALFYDILLPISEKLLEYIVDNTQVNVDKALDAVRDLESAIVDPVKNYREELLSTTLSSSLSNDSDAGINISSNPTLEIRASTKAASSDKKEVNRSFKVEHEDKVFFPEIYSSLTRALVAANIQLYILIDEWSSLPLDIQPYLAEFLKRSVLPIQRATLKIACLEYRSRFSLPTDNLKIGFEVGADISVALDLDDYFVFERNPHEITKTYADILYRHIQIELPDSYLESKYGVKSGNQMVQKMFTQHETFVELARASEGVVRDLINIFNHAFFQANRKKRKTIDRASVVGAARSWFEQDKVKDLDESMHTVLQRIIRFVIGEKQARSFLLPRNLERDPMMQKLFDARVLHHMQRGYADKDNPGIRYNIYSLDYGTYVDLIGTSKQPQLFLSNASNQSNEDDVDEMATFFLEETNALDEIVVPFDDKRSIRRIILDERLLKVNPMPIH